MNTNTHPQGATLNTWPWSQNCIGCAYGAFVESPVDDIIGPSAYICMININLAGVYGACRKYEKASDLHGSGEQEDAR